MLSLGLPSNTSFRFSHLQVNFPLKKIDSTLMIFSGAMV